MPKDEEMNPLAVRLRQIADSLDAGTPEEFVVVSPNGWAAQHGTNWRALWMHCTDAALQIRDEGREQKEPGRIQLLNG